MFVAAIGGVIIGGAIAHGNYSDHSNHRNYHEYGDSQMRQQIDAQKSRVDNKEYEVSNLKQRMDENFNRQINQLRSEKNYPALNSSPADMIKKIKSDMRKEIESELSRENQELAEINRMIARINELELQSRR